MPTSAAHSRRQTAALLTAGLMLLTANSVLAQSQDPGLAAPASPMASPGASPFAPSPSAVASDPASPGASAAVGTHDVTMLGREFHPATIEVTVGETVDWFNDDGEQHTVTALDGSFNSGLIAIGATFDQAFETPGSFDYLCAIHPLMTGTVVVSG